jgi:glyceraldehyde 3-phosphate dehydrogenase
VGRHQRAHGRRDGGRSINAGVAERADRGHLAGIFGYSDEPLVSGDIVGCSYSGVFDAGLTSVVGGTQAEVVAWNDNE